MKKITLLLLGVFMVLGLIGLRSTEAQVTVSGDSQASLIAQLNLQIQALQAQLTQLTSQVQANTNASGSASLGQALSVAINLGAKGEDVKILQAILAGDATVYPEGLITGKFGPLTAKALTKFKAKFGISESGMGAATLAKLNAEVDGSLDIDIDANGATHPCAIVPPGHLIAPGWLRHHNGVQIVPACQVLPQGIAAQLSGSLNISAVNASAVASGSATVNWSTNVNTTGKVFYSTTTPVNTSIAASVMDNASAATHSVTLTGLSANTTYYFVIQANDASGNVNVSTSYSLMTAVSGDVTAPAISAVATTNASNSATVTWTTNEAATSKVYYSASTPVNKATAQVVSNANLTVSHSMVLTGLSANTTYHTLVESTDASGNMSTSAESQFTTSS